MLNLNLENYLPLFLFILIGIGVGIIPMILGRLLGPHHPNSEKLSAYECGFEAFEDARMQFDVRYYLIAILFILFDLETALLVPWAVTANQSSSVVFITVMLFLVELLIGFFYLWKKGALDWE